MSKSTLAVALLMPLCLTLLSSTFAIPIEEVNRTATRDIKILAAEIRKARGGDMITSAKLGEQDNGFAVITANSRWQKLSPHQRKSLVKSWWVRWAELRARYENFVGLTVYDRAGKELMHAYGDTRGDCQFR